MARILLIDDDVDLVEMNRLVLAHRGHEVRCAYSAAEGREALGKETPEAVVLDIMMEEADAGLELAREIRRRYPSLPTLVLSGIHTASGGTCRYQPDAEFLPVTKFLDKPVSPTELARQVEEMVKKQKEGNRQKGSGIGQP